MARSFNGSSDFISVPVNLSAFSKLSVSFWLKWTTFANNDHLAMEYSANYGSNTGAFIINPNSSSPVAGVFYIGWNAGGALGTAHFTRPSAGAWHHYLFPIDFTVSGNGSIPAVYVDGVSQSLTYDLTGTGTTNFGNYTLYLMSRAGSTLFGAGSMADMAIWGGILLTAGEAGALANGARPNKIRPTLAHWEPIDGLVSPEPDLSGGKINGTVTGTALIGGPPINMLTPRWPQFLIPPAVTSTIVQRRTLDNLGTRVGSRQLRAA